MKALLRPASKVAFVFGVTALAWFSVPAAVVAICASILAALYGKLGTIIEISFGPLKAKLEREITEAEKLLQSLRKLALVQAKTAISIGARTGRWSSEDDWNYQTVRQLEAALREAGVDEASLKEARQDFVQFTVRDLAYCVMGGAYVPMNLGVEARREYDQIRKGDGFTNPDQLEQYLKKWNVLTPEREVRIADMRWLVDNGDVGDQEQYMRSQVPVPWPGQQ